MPHGDDSGWIQTYTGRMFWPLDPRADDVCIEDVAHALSMKCRFTGHCREFYSVAQHSILVAQHVPPAYRLTALLHDAAEAYLHDVARPIKYRIAVFDEEGLEPVAWFSQAEQRVLACVFDALGISVPSFPSWPKCIETADHCALATECRDLMGPPPRPWFFPAGVGPFAEPIRPQSPEVAKQMFLIEFHSAIANAPCVPQAALTTAPTA